MALIDIEIEDHLGEVNDSFLVDELKRRGYKCTKVIAKNNIDDDIPEFESELYLKTYLRKLLRLRSWHDDKRVVTEIQQIFS